MTRTERIEILSEVVVITITMQKVSKEFLNVPTTPSNIDTHLELARLLKKLLEDTQSLANTVDSMK